MVNKKTKSQKPSGPSPATIKRLFAQSGNCCAFPKCPVDIIQGATVMGNICHIKAASPKGPRYDALQTPEDRHGYDNLILLCANHHTVIDDDEDAYTIERLTKMKRDHELCTSPMKNKQIELGAQLLIDQDVTTINQSGGIAAHTIHTINVHQSHNPESSATSNVSPPVFPAVDPMNGKARFRPLRNPLGIDLNPHPFSVAGTDEVFLSDGPAMWLRLIPCVNTTKKWSAKEMKECAIRDAHFNLKPLTDYSLRFLRAKDGLGAYSYKIIGVGAPIVTDSVAFAFETGEIWSIDTSLLACSKEYLMPVDIEKDYTVCLKGYAHFLKDIGIEGPYRWICGLEGVKNRRLVIPSKIHPYNIPGPPCLDDVIIAEGTFDTVAPPAVILRPFFELIFRMCGEPYPGP